MSFFSRLFGADNTPSLSEVLSSNAIVVDVRTPSEYRGGHVAGSKNIPLDTLESALHTLPTDRPVVFCCASGARSGAATKLAVGRGLQAINGGPWTNVQQHIQRG